MTKLNKITSVLLSAIMVIGIFSIIPFAAGAETTGTSGSFEYSVLDDGTASITKYIDNGSKTVDIPSTIDGYKVTEIGWSAFGNCTGLNNVTIPNSVKRIDYNAFIGCTGLKSVTIPNSVTEIAGSAFFGCTGLKSVTVDKNNKNYTSADGILFNKNKTAILIYPSAKDSSSYVIPSSVTEIGDSAFYGCTGLKSVTIPSSVTGIYSYAFYGCTGLKSITVDKNNKNYTSVDGVLFNKDKTEILIYPSAKDSSSYVIPNSVTEIRRDAFSRCISLTTIKIPQSVTNIAEVWGYPRSSFSNPFWGCTKLREFIVDTNNTKYSSIDGVLFDKKKGVIVAYPNAKGSSYVIPNSVWNIREGAFKGCTGLTNIVIPDSVEYIGGKQGGLYFAGAFEGCTGLKSVTIPGSVTEIGSYTFSNCTSLTSVTISNGVAEIGYSAFEGCTSLKSVTIPSTVTEIGYFDRAFNGCTSLKSITVDKSNKNYTSVDGILFNKNKTAILIYPSAKDSSSYVIPSSVTKIDNYAFYGCTSLKSVTIPSSVTEIGDYAFNDKIKDFTIYGTKGTVAERYANDNGFKFVEGTAPVEPAVPTEVNLNQSNLTLGKGESYGLVSTVLPANAKNKTCTWSTSNSSVATVSNTGKVTAKAVGTAVITVKTVNGKTATCKVTVKLAPTSIKTNPTSLTLGKGEKYTISESTNSGSYANAANLKWISTNTKVATVQKGSGNKAVVKAVGTGTADVKITLFNGKTATCKVTVKPAPTSIKTNPTSLTLGKGESYTISESTNSGSYANAANLKWTSTNTKVVTVQKGSGNKAVVKAVGTGTADVKITLFNGKTATCKVTVKPAPTSIKTNPTSLTLGKGESYTISESTNSGSYANAANLKWTSTNTRVATVQKGKGNKAVIKAVGTGTANIKITLFNGKTATCKVKVKPAPTSVKINPTALTLGKGESYTISESTSKGSYANGANLKWTSTNTRVATVQKGKGNKAVIKAVGTGTADVKITLFNGKTATCKVTVKPAPTSIKTNPTAITLGKGESYTISESTNSGSYANAANLKWTSTNTKVITVQKGSGNKAVVKAVGTGTADVKITLFNGKTATCKVTVVKNNIAGQLSSLLKHNGKLYYSSYTPEATPGKYISNGLTEPLPKSIRNKAGSFTIVNNYIYYLDKVVYSGDYSLNVYRCNLDGTGNKLICSDYKNSNGFFGGIICGNKFYYNNNSGTVVRNIDSGKVTVLSKEYISWLGVSNKNIGYFCRDYKLYSYNFETDTQKCVTTDVSSVVGIEDGYVYYIPLHFNGTHVPVYKVNVTSGKSTHIFNASDTRIAVSDGKVYYCERSNYGTSNYCDYIKSYNLGTGVTETLQKVKSQYAYSAVEHFSVESGYITYLVATGESILVKQHVIDPNSKKDYVVSEFSVSSF
ncbi:leucine-rich repeat protein [Oscillospiraceae bacterium LCP25S3_E3]